jgi:hypothetical protein
MLSELHFSMAIVMGESGFSKSRIEVRPGENASYTRKLKLILFVLVVLAVAAGLRLRGYGEPPNRDLATYEVVAREILYGKQLYADVWDHKPPAIFWTYAAGERILGRGPLLFYTLSLAALIAAFPGVWFITRQLGGTSSISALSALLFVIISCDVNLQATEANAEIFMNAAIALALAFLLSGIRRAEKGRILIAGVLLGIGSLFKTVLIAQAFAFELLLLLQAWNWRRKWVMSGCFVLGAAMPWVFSFGYFAWQHTLRDFVNAVFTFNRYYASQNGSIPGSILRGISFRYILPLFARSIYPALILAVAGFAWNGRHLSKLTKHLAILWGVATLFSVAMPGQFYPHYYQLWILPASVFGAIGVRALLNRFAGFKNLRRFLPITLLATTLCLVLPPYAFSADKWARIKYGDDIGYEKLIGKYLNETLAPGETFYQWGSSVTLYYFSDRRPPSGILFLSPAIDGPLSSWANARLIKDLKAARPKLFLYDFRDVPRMDQIPVIQWMNRNYTYTRMDPVQNRFGIFTRMN